MLFTISIIFILLVVQGGLMLYDHKNNIPPRKASRNLVVQSARKKPLRIIIEDTFVEPLATIIIATPLMKLLKVDTKIKLKRDLVRVGIVTSPEEYYSRAIAMSIYAMLVPAFLMLLGMQAVAILSLSCPIICYFHFTTTYQEELKKKKKQIEYIMPSFIRAIIYKLNDNGSNIVIAADLISIFEDYHRIAPTAILYDIQKLITEMKTKEIETALYNFNMRIGIPEVAILTDALIGITRGEKQTEVLNSLAREMDLKIKNITREELEKRPGKVVIASIPLLIMAIIAIMYVMITATLNGINNIL